MNNSEIQNPQIESSSFIRMLACSVFSTLRLRILYCKHAPKLGGKQIRDRFFERVKGTDHIWICQCGAKRSVKGSGYTNFVAHVNDPHLEANKILETEFSCQSDSFRSHEAFLNLSYTSKAFTIHGWIATFLNRCQSNHNKTYPLPDI